MISCLVVWPDSFDFPIFRQRYPKLSQHVDETLICFTRHGEHTLDSWVRQNLKPCRYFDASISSAVRFGGDWRNQATNLLINESYGDWVLFMEPDFFIKDYEHFFSKIKECMKEYDVVGFEESKRFHPAFLLCRKEMAVRTERDFSATPTLDHFGSFTKQLKSFAKFKKLADLDLVETRDWFHMGGLTENYFAPKPYYRLSDFYTYNDVCLGLDVPMSDYWEQEMSRVKSSYWEDAEKILEFL